MPTKKTRERRTRRRVRRKRNKQLAQGQKGPQQAESAPFRDAGSALGGIAGSFLGSPKIGSLLGGVLGSGVGKLFGSGEYHEALQSELGVPVAEPADMPETNSLVEPLSTNDLVPLMHHNQEGAVTITRREYMFDITILTAGSNFNFFIGPAQQQFVWLSGIAKSWQKFAFTGLAMEYVPLSGTAVSSTSAALGQVAMCFNYNVVESTAAWPRGVNAAILNMNGAVGCSPAAAAACYMECDPKQAVNPFCFINNEQPAVSNWSQSDYFPAEFILRTSGAQNLTTPFVCGALWCTYEVVLLEPRPVDPTPDLSYMNMPAFKDFVSVLTERRVLSNHCGPYTDRQLMLRAAELRRLVAILRSLPFADALEKACLQSWSRREEDDTATDQQDQVDLIVSQLEAKYKALTTEVDAWVQPVLTSTGSKRSK